MASDDIHKFVAEYLQELQKQKRRLEEIEGTEPEKLQEVADGIKEQAEHWPETLLKVYENSEGRVGKITSDLKGESVGPPTPQIHGYDPAIPVVIGVVGAIGVVKRFVDDLKTSKKTVDIEGTDKPPGGDKQSGEARLANEIKALQEQLREKLNELNRIKESEHHRAMEKQEQDRSR